MNRRYDNSELWDDHSDQLRETLPTSTIINQVDLDAMALPSPFPQLVDAVDQPTLDWESDPSCSRLASCLNMNQTEPAQPVHESDYDRPTDFNLSVLDGPRCESISRCGSWGSLVDIPCTPANYQDTANPCETQLGCASNECNEKDVAEEYTVNDEKPDDSKKYHRPPRTRSLMERKRREKIKQKIEVLHSLVPYGRKRDKASMLDEVAEYIRSLQLHLQSLPMQMSLQARSLARGATTAQRRFPQYQHLPPVPGQGIQGMSSLLFPQLAQPSALRAPPQPWMYNFSYFPLVQAAANLYSRPLNLLQYPSPAMPIQFTRPITTDTSVQVRQESSINDDEETVRAVPLSPALP